MKAAIGVLAAILICRSPLAAEVKLSAEVPLADIKLRPASVASGSLTAASNGHDFLLAWQDNRLGGPDIFGTRVGIDGRPADPLGRHIAAGSGPKLTRAGSGYLLVWRASSGIQSLRRSEA